MENKKFWWAVGAVWIVMFVTDWVLHGMWLGPLYQENPQFWKTEEAMKSMLWASWLGNAIFAWAFVWIYGKGISHDNPWGQAFRYALAILMVSKVPTLLGQWTYYALPNEMFWKWGIVFIIQALACSFTMVWVWKSNWVAAPQRN